MCDWMVQSEVICKMSIPYKEISLGYRSCSGPGRLTFGEQGFQCDSFDYILSDCFRVTRSGEIVNDNFDRFKMKFFRKAILIELDKMREKAREKLRVKNDR